MTSVSSISIGARMAGGAGAAARHGMNEAIARLSTGKRGMYGGDASGMTTAYDLKAKGMSYGAAARNIESGISVAQTMESALLEIANLAVRLRELAIQADNEAILSDNDEAALNKEAEAICDTIDAIVTQTKFNGVAILSSADVTLAIGCADADATTTNVKVSGMTSVSGVSSAAGAETTADTTIGEVGTNLGLVAASMTALKARQGVAYSTSANLLAASSRVMDTDFAASSANLSKFAILNQSAMAMVAQANQAQSAILAVLQ